MKFLRFPPRRPGAPLTRLAAAAAVAVGLFPAAAGPARAEPPRYTAVDLGTLSDVNGEWRGHLSGVGINDSGDVAGWGYLPLPGSPPRMVPVLRSGGQWVDLSSGGARAGAAYDVNNTGTSVGSTHDPTAETYFGERIMRATRWTADGGAVELGSLGDPPTGPRLSSSAVAVNDDGLIVGWAQAPPEAGGGPHAVVWRNDIITRLEGLGGSQSQASDVNSAGLVVGNALTADGYRAVLWKDGVPTNLGAFSGDWEYSRATAINDAGWIVGVSYRSDSGGTYRAVLWRDGVMTDLGTPAPDGGGGLPGAMAHDINNSGDIVGTWFDREAFLNRAFLHTGGVMYDLRSLLPPEWEDFTFSSLSINDAGWFTGTVMRDGEAHLYLFKPVPEPSAAALALCAGTGALSFRRRRSGKNGDLPVSSENFLYFKIPVPR